METPNRKVKAGALAGALSILLIWVIQAASGAVITGEAASAMTVVLTFIVSYFVREPA
jgi:hypothetical protein